MVCSFSLFAENIVFPKNLKYNDNVTGSLDGAGSVINIANNPWNINCNNTGTVDVSVTLQRLFDSLTIHANTGAILYIPNGTYLVSKTFRLPECQNSNPNDFGCGRGWSIVGQSTNGAVIKLKAGTFTDPLNPRPVLLSGSGVAQNMNRFFNNFTIYIDSNNAGADGIFWSANNVSVMRDVSIISKGIANIAVNLDGNTGKYLGVNATSGDEQDPTLIQSIYMEGFKIGINSDALNAV